MSFRLFYAKHSVLAFGRGWLGPEDPALGEATAKEYCLALAAAELLPGTYQVRAPSEGRNKKYPPPSLPFSPYFSLSPPLPLFSPASGPPLRPGRHRAHVSHGRLPRPHAGRHPALPFLLRRQDPGLPAEAGAAQEISLRCEAFLIFGLYIFVPSSSSTPPLRWHSPP